MKNNLRRLIREQNGQDLVEYGLLIAIVALGAVAALTAFQTAIGTAWAAISAMLSN
jgi:pilus assembly protein Flp/PilA